MVPEEIMFTDIVSMDCCGWEWTTVTDKENEASVSDSGTSSNGSTLVLSSWHTGHLTTERNCAWNREYMMPGADSNVPLSAATLLSDPDSPSRHAGLRFADEFTCFMANLSYQRKIQIIHPTRQAINCSNKVQPEDYNRATLNVWVPKHSNSSDGQLCQIWQLYRVRQ